MRNRKWVLTKDSEMPDGLVSAVVFYDSEFIRVVRRLGRSVVEIDSHNRLLKETRKDYRFVRMWCPLVPPPFSRPSDRETYREIFFKSLTERDKELIGRVRDGYESRKRGYKEDRESKEDKGDRRRARQPKSLPSKG